MTRWPSGRGRRSAAAARLLRDHRRRALARGRSRRACTRSDASPRSTSGAGLATTPRSASKRRRTRECSARSPALRRLSHALVLPALRVQRLAGHGRERRQHERGPEHPRGHRRPGRGRISDRRRARSPDRGDRKPEITAGRPLGTLRRCAPASRAGLAAVPTRSPRGACRSCRRTRAPSSARTAFDRAGS